MTVVPTTIRPAPGAAGAAAAAGHPRGDDTVLRRLAGELEATFLAEMLKAAGFGKPREAFGGGQGEDQFASFLRQAQAERMVRAGGIGLSEALFHALKENRDDT